MQATTLGKLKELDRIVHDTSGDYHNSTPFVQYSSSSQGEITFDIKDMLLIAAITETPVLMIGATDTGKTTIARLVMNSLFGPPEKGFTKMDMDTEFTQDTLASTDFGALVEGKTSEDLHSLLDQYRLPGLIIDEMNRIDPRIAAKLLHIILEKDVMIGSKREQLGANINGRNYQFQVCAVNEKYKGTFEMDEALRRRTVMELPLDYFPPSMLDRSRINKTALRSIPLPGTENHLADIVTILGDIEGLEMSVKAEHFLLYLQAMDSCVYSPNQAKSGFENRAGKSLKQYCLNAGGMTIHCRFINKYDKELCPNTRGLSSGVSKNLILLSRGFAAMRMAKLSQDQSQLEAFAQDATIDIADIMNAVPFVGYSKMGISSEWVEKEFKSSRWSAISGVTRTAYSHFMNFYMQNANLIADSTSQPNSESVEKLMRTAFQTDHFMYHSLVPYFADQFPLVLKIPETYNGKP